MLISRREPLSLRAALELPSLRAGRPLVLCGHHALDRPVRWAHVSELSDIGTLLRGGELVLTTGIGLPEDPAALRQYVDELTTAGVGALVVELGRRFDNAPRELVAAAEQAGLPLIVLEREVPFVAITEAIHTRIVDAQVVQLRRSERIHQRFTELSVEGAPVEEVIDAAAELSEGRVILEDLAHRVLAIGGQTSGDGHLERWQARSRGVHTDHGTTEVAPGEVWTVVPVAARGQRWGRLIAISPTAPEDAAQVLERCAAALAVNRLSERDAAAVRTRAHREVLTALIDRSYRNGQAIDAQARALGVPLIDRTLLGVVVTVDAKPTPGVGTDGGLALDDLERVLAVAQGRVTALVDTAERGGVRLLVSLPRMRSVQEVIAPFARAIHNEVAHTSPDSLVTIGVGSAVHGLWDVERTLLEAAHVAAAAPAADRRKDYFELLDVRVRGLIHVLRDDPRLQHFVERELGPLLDTEDARTVELLHTLEVFLETGRNKRSTADALRMSRPSVYTRLRSIEALLDADLDDVETALSLHVALLGRRSIVAHDAGSRAG